MLTSVLELYLTRWDFFWRLTLEHLTLSAVAILIASLVGLALGVLISEYQKVSPFVFGLVNFIYTIPSISLLGFLIPFSGIGNVTAVIALTVYALLPMVRNTHAGIEGIDPAVIEAATGMGSTRLQLLYKIKLPLAFPTIVAGLRNMVVMTIALAGIASFIGAGGLGVAIYRGITTNNSAMVLAGSLLIAFLALFLDFALGMAEKIVARKSSSAKSVSRVSRIAAGFLAVGLILVFASGLFRSAGTVHIATKPMTEQFILGDMLRLLIEDETDLRVRMTQGVGGGTGNIHPALVKGDFDLYPEYTGTAWSYVLKRTGIPPEERLRDELYRDYRSEYGLEWVGLYGFNNTYGLAVRQTVAERYGLKTYSDLAAAAPDLTFGAEYDFYERDDGYEDLCDTYGLSFGKTVDMDIGLKYQAINSGEIDVMPIFTTDGQLSVSEIAVLRDDKGFFQNYYCGTVVRTSVLEQHPGLRSALLKMDGIVDDAEMARLNYEVEGKKRDSRQVAREYLLQRGLLVDGNGGGR